MKTIPDEEPEAAGLRRWMLVASCVCAILVIPVIWDGRYTIWADSISYLDMASDTLRKSPGSLVNGYWSPGYPALLAVMMWIARPTPAAEFPAVHVLDWLIFLFTTACFSLFLGNFVKWLKGNTWPELSRDTRLLKTFLLFLMRCSW